MSRLKDGCLSQKAGSDIAKKRNHGLRHTQEFNDVVPAYNNEVFEYFLRSRTLTLSIRMRRYLAFCIFLIFF